MQAILAAQTSNCASRYPHSSITFTLALSGNTSGPIWNFPRLLQMSLNNLPSSLTVESQVACSLATRGVRTPVQVLWGVQTHGASHSSFASDIRQLLQVFACSLLDDIGSAADGDTPIGSIRSRRISRRGSVLIK